MGQPRAPHATEPRSAGQADGGAAAAAPPDRQEHRQAGRGRERRQHPGRVARPNSGAYSASKFALAGWSDALYAEERAHGVHVGLVLPGFIATEGFPANELRARLATRWIVSRPDKVAAAIVEAGPGGKPERYVPRPYWMAAALRILAPALVRRAVAGGAFTTATGTRDE